MRHVWILIVVLLGSIPTVFANADFEQIKSLAGEWEGRGARSGVFTVAYSLISDGTAVMETIQAGEHHRDMTTIYCVDGDQVVMTHFCAENNQPRMRSTHNQEPGALDFDIVDVTNLPDPAAGHMVKLTFRWQDKNHFAQEWTYRESGKDQQEVFSLSRKVEQASLQRDDSCVTLLPQTKWFEHTDLIPMNSSSGVARWEAECRIDGRRETTPQESECTCRPCECK